MAARNPLGQSHHPLYKTYWHMTERCYNEKCESYKNYGGRGIRMCDDWRKGDGVYDGFTCFTFDMGKKPTPDHTIERIDNNGNYEPDNCRWATRYEQAQNKRPYPTGKSGITCISWNEKQQMWHVTYKKKYLGRFKHLQDAKAALPHKTQVN